MVLHKELDADDGELTRTRKVRRGFIADKYAMIVNALYSDAPMVEIDAQVRFEDGRTGTIRANLVVEDRRNFPPWRQRPHEPMSTERKIGNVILSVENISLAFGGVQALSDISFDVKEHEIRAIIGPNGAGKSSMLNVINGVYHPQQGTVTFRGEKRHEMEPHRVASQGVARTFRSLALFRGMSVLDNLMTGRNLQIKTNLFQQALYWGAAQTEELKAPRTCGAHHRFPGDPVHPQDAGRPPAIWIAEAVDLGRALAMEPSLLLLDEPMAGMNVEEKQDMCRFVLDVNEGIWHHHRTHQSTTWGGDGHFRSRGGAGLRQENR